MLKLSSSRLTDLGLQPSFGGAAITTGSSFRNLEHGGYFHFCKSAKKPALDDLRLTWAQFSKLFKSVAQGENVRAA